MLQGIACSLQDDCMVITYIIAKQGTCFHGCMALHNMLYANNAMTCLLVYFIAIRCVSHVVLQCLLRVLLHAVSYRGTWCVSLIYNFVTLYTHCAAARAQVRAYIAQTITHHKPEV